MKEFFLRVDVESDKGIREGLPRLLDMLKDVNCKASFYLVMGGESNIFDLIRYRRPMKGERKLKVFSNIEVARMLLFPKDFVKSNMGILKRILDEGHELGIHGWKHRAWTRGIDQIDVRKHIILSKRRYFQLFNKNPTSFAAPGFVSNNKILEILDKEGFKVISDLPGNKPKKISKNLINIPITINGENNSPFIESLVSLGKEDDEIFLNFQKAIKGKKLVSFYIHDLFEARFKIDLLKKMITLLKVNKLRNKRAVDFK